MVSSKELLEVLCLLAKLPEEEKRELLRCLHSQEEIANSLWQLFSSQEQAE